MPQEVALALKGFWAALLMSDLGSGSFGNSPEPHIAHSCTTVKISGLPVPYLSTLFQILTSRTLSFTPHDGPGLPWACFQLQVKETLIQNGLSKKRTSFLRYQNAWKQDSSQFVNLLPQQPEGGPRIFLSFSNVTLCKPALYLTAHAGCHLSRHHGWTARHSPEETPFPVAFSTSPCLQRHRASPQTYSDSRPGAIFFFLFQADFSDDLALVMGKDWGNLLTHFQQGI